MKKFQDYAFVSNLKYGSNNNLQDNIGIAKRTISESSELFYNNREIRLVENIPVGSFFTIKNVNKGDNIVSFGVVVGKATRSLKEGELVDNGKNDCITETEIEECKPLSVKPQPTQYDPSLLKRTFNGFRCKVTIDGKEGGGTGNVVAILNTVKCSAVAARNISHLAKKRFLDKYSNVTDVIAITHESGCGMPEGDSRNELLRILINIMNHPNIRTVFLLGLGCEHLTSCTEMPENIIPFLRSDVIDFDGRVMFGHLQQYANEIEAVEHITNGPVKDLLAVADKYSREPLPLSYLTLGLKCGGSDIFSGICSNPTLGYAVDKLVKAGAAAIITETPEFDGNMHILAARARNEEVFSKIQQLLPKFHDMSQKYPISGSGRQKVAPGNKQGGLLNIIIKAASAIQKCGTTTIEGVLNYCDWIYDTQPRGVWILDCPSYDQISTPALGLSGSQMVAFTTGLGTPIGSPLGQVVKIGNRRDMGLKDQVDLFTEDILNGKSIEEMGEELFEFIVSVASGSKSTKVEEFNTKLYKRGFSEGHYEFMLWKRWGDN
jgi:altronate hydrolase